MCGSFRRLVQARVAEAAAEIAAEPPVLFAFADTESIAAQLSDATALRELPRAVAALDVFAVAYPGGSLC